MTEHPGVVAFRRNNHLLIAAPVRKSVKNTTKTDKEVKARKKIESVQYLAVKIVT